MEKEKFYTAKTFEKAKELAISDFLKLGVSEYDIDFEIIERPVKKLFGVKGEYKIRACVSETDVISLDGFSDGTDIILREKVSVPERDYSAYADYKEPEPLPEKQQRPPRRDSEPRERSPRFERPKRADNVREYKAEQDEDKTPLPPFPEDAVREYLGTLLTGIGVAEYEAKFVITGSRADCLLTSERSGVIIGRRGETLDALQYLVGLAKNQLGGERYKLTIDCNDYREKRHTALEDTAAKNAEKVLKTGRRCALEPMSSYERRIIHNRVSKIPGVTSSSIGSEPYRKVVIYLVGDKGFRTNAGGAGGGRDRERKPPYHGKK